jgi:hypothetical protein
MFGPFQYNQWEQCEVYADGVRYHLDDAILIEVLGGASSSRPDNHDANIELCERERSRIEAACRKALARESSGSDTIALTRGDFATGIGIRLMLTFPDSKTAQQFSGWIYSMGYPERIVSQNTVTVEVLHQDRGRVIEEATGRNGRVVA